MKTNSAAFAAVLSFAAISLSAQAGQDVLLGPSPITGAQGGWVKSIDTISGSAGLAYVPVQDAGIYKTTNYGATWTESDTGITNRRIRMIRHDPLTAGVLYAATYGGDGFYRSTDSGATWQASNTGLTRHFLTNLFVAGTAGTVYAPTNCGLYWSGDEGVSWSQYSGIPCTSVSTVRPSADGVNIRVATAQGVYISSDSGATFTLSSPSTFDTVDVRPVSGSPGTILAAVRGQGIQITTNGGTNWAAVTGIPANSVPMSAIIPIFNGTTTDYWVSMDGYGVYKSADGGATWALVTTLSGLPTKSVRFVIPDSTTTTTWWGITVAGVYISTDSGANWTKASSGLPQGQVVNFSSDPTNHDIAYAEADTIYKTTDGGATWAPANTGLGGNTYQAHGVHVDQSTPSTVYVSTAHAGIYKSTDSGATWNAINNGLPSMASVAPRFGFSASSPNTIYVALEDGSGVWKTTDGGANWSDASGNLGSLSSAAMQARSVAVDPTDPNRVFVATHAGVFGTTDGGATWQWKNPGGFLSFNINEVELLPSDPQTLLAVAYDVDKLDHAQVFSGAFLSRDGGDTWRQLISNEKLTSGRFVQTPGGEVNAYFISWGNFDGTQVDSEGVYKCTDVTGSDFQADDEHCTQVVAPATAGIPWSLGAYPNRAAAIATSEGGYKLRFRFLGPDFNNDGRADILWRKSTTGENADWLMYHSGFRNGASGGGVNMLQSVGSPWEIAATGDFDGDGTSDILWRNTSTGEDYIFFVDRGNVLPSSGYTNSVPTNWEVAGTGDFDGDGKADILWRDTTTGDNFIFFMNGTTVLGTSNYTNNVPTTWQVGAIGDFDGDGKSDILWRNTSTGEDYVFFMNGTTVAGNSGYTSTVPTAWQVAGVGDFNQDGKYDIVWRNPTTGENYVFVMDGLTVQGTSGYLPTVPGANWQIAGVSDFDGPERSGGTVATGISDLLWRNSTDGSLYMWQMTGPTTLGGFCNQMACSNGNLPTVPDTNWQIVAK